jgi:large subunit ribosomal protein L23
MIRVIPRMSEKAYQQSTINQTYVFMVSPTANKMQIKSAVEARFKVTVLDVNIVLQNGKKARSIRLGNRSARPITGRRSDLKKAYVRLKAGDSIKIFEEEETK